MICSVRDAEVGVEGKGDASGRVELGQAIAQGDRPIDIRGQRLDFEIELIVHGMAGAELFYLRDNCIGGTLPDILSLG